ADVRPASDQARRAAHHRHGRRLPRRDQPPRPARGPEPQGRRGRRQQELGGQHPYRGPVALSSLRPLRHRNYALIWSAALVSNVGSWMQPVAVGALVTAKTPQSAWTGIVAAAAFIPIGIVSPIGGAMADRVDRRRWFIRTTIGE